jgi:hypothetical protein
MDKTQISNKLTFIKDRIHENEYMEVLAICNLYEREIERLKRNKEETK